MDPNASLKEIRAIVKMLDGMDKSDYRYQGLVADLIGTINGLDDSLTRGGYLPEAWVSSTPEGLADLEAHIEVARTNLAALETHFDRWPLGSVFVDEKLTFGIQGVKNAQVLVDKMLSRAQNK